MESHSGFLFTENSSPGHGEAVSDEQTVGGWVHWKVSYYSGATITKCYGLGGLNNRHSFHHSGGWEI